MASVDPTDVKKIVINDEINDLQPMSHLPVRYCIIKHFCRPLPQNYRLFQSLTKQLKIVGDITVDNFKKLIECANELEHLHLSGRPLSTANLMMSLCNNVSFREFWDNLTKLVLSIDLKYEETEKIRENVICLFGCRMNNLKDLSLEINNKGQDNCIAIIDSVIGFLAEHPTLVTLKVKMCRLAKEGDPEPLDDNLREKLVKAKLESLYIAIDVCYVRAWTRLITSFKTLKTLNVYVTVGDHFNFQTIPESFIMNTLKEALANNKDTLTSIDLDLYGIIPPMNAEIFSGMTNLKELTLFNYDGVKKEIVNLKLLPASLEKLDLTDFICESDDIVEMKSRLKNIQSMSLGGTGEHDISSKPEQHDISSKTEQHDISSKTEQHDISSKTEQHDISSKTEQDDISSKTEQHDISSKTEQHDISSKTEQHDISSKTEQHDISSKTEQQDISSKTEQRGPFLRSRVKRKLI